MFDGIMNLCTKEVQKEQEIKKKKLIDKEYATVLKTYKVSKKTLLKRVDSMETMPDPETFKETK